MQNFTKGKNTWDKIQQGVVDVLNKCFGEEITTHNEEYE